MICMKFRRGLFVEDVKQKKTKQTRINHTQANKGESFSKESEGDKTT